jgi:hypothetical protein
MKEREQGIVVIYEPAAMEPAQIDKGPKKNKQDYVLCTNHRRG